MRKAKTPPLSQPQYESALLKNMQRCWDSVGKLSGHAEESKRPAILEGDAIVALYSVFIRAMFSEDPIIVHNAVQCMASSRLARLDAYRIFSAFPLPFFQPESVPSLRDTLSQEEILVSYRFFERVGCYLINRELSLGIGALLDAEFGSVRKYADLAELRYLLIRSLCEKGIIPQASPEVPWLLAEASSSICGIRNTTIEQQEGPKRISSLEQAYRIGQNKINVLKGKRTFQKSKQSLWI